MLQTPVNGREPADARLLTSWKNIAAYLGVTVRTAQRWEAERGLPVRRPLGKAGVVEALVEELDRWKQSNGGASTEVVERPAALPPAAASKPSRSRIHSVLATGVAAIALFAGAVLLWAVTQKPEPVDVRVYRTGFAALGRLGDKLWHKTFPEPLEPSAYKSTRMFAVVDLDGEGANEVLFVHQAPNESGVLICYSAEGRELWRWAPASEMRAGETVFRPPFPIVFIDVNGAGKDARIIAAAHHHLYYPTHLVVLSGRGQVLGDYRHSGRLPVAFFTDLNGDGKREILAAGVNNAWKSATVVVLDPDAATGVSAEPERPAFQIAGMPPARELARLILPTTSLGRSLSPFNMVTELRIDGDDLTAVVVEDQRTGASVVWHFSRGLKPLSVSASSWYSAACAKLSGTHAAQCSEELPKLRSQVRAIKAL